MNISELGLKNFFYQTKPTSLNPLKFRNLG